MISNILISIQLSISFSFFIIYDIFFNFYDFQFIELNICINFYFYFIYLNHYILENTVYLIFLLDIFVFHRMYEIAIEVHKLNPHSSMRVAQINEFGF